MRTCARTYAPLTHANYSQPSSAIVQPRKREEKHLQKTVSEIFTLSPHYHNLQIIYNAKKFGPNLIKILTIGRKTYHELDVWIPSLKLGFEYQVSNLLVILLTHIHLAHTRSLTQTFIYTYTHAHLAACFNEDLLFCF